MFSGVCGVPVPRPSQTLLAKSSLLQSLMFLLRGGSEAEQAHACPAIEMGLDCIWDHPKLQTKGDGQPSFGLPVFTSFSI